jgi:hypothetical protein
VDVVNFTWNTRASGLAILGGSIVALVVWILICYFVGRAGDRKHRSFTSFFLIAFFVSPIVGAVIVAALPPSPEMLIAKGLRKACNLRGGDHARGNAMPTLRPGHDPRASRAGMGLGHISDCHAV